MNKWKLRVWWIPQIPMSNPFQVDVSSIEEGVKMLAVLAEYDGYQLANNIKPDYCNTGGIWMWCDDYDGEGNSGWNDWYDEATGIDDPIEFLEWLGKEIPSVMEKK